MILWHLYLSPKHTWLRKHFLYHISLLIYLGFPWQRFFRRDSNNKQKNSRDVHLWKQWLEMDEFLKKKFRFFLHFPLSASTTSVSVESPTKQSILLSGDKDEHFWGNLSIYYFKPFLIGTYVCSKRQD